MRSVSKVITVFGSSRPHPGDAGYEEARHLGASLAAQGFMLCTGGYGGVMEAVSRGAREAGGKTLAVTAQFFSVPVNAWVDEEIRVATWQDRLFQLIQRGNGFVACAGGTGTLVELSMVWEMQNKGVCRRKPFLALGDFWRPIVERVREVEMAHETCWEEAAGPLIQFAATPEDAARRLAELLRDTQPIPLSKGQ